MARAAQGVMNLDAQFRALSQPPSESDSSFSADVLPGLPRYRIARDAAGRPALLVAPLDGTNPSVRLGSELKYVSFLPAAICDVRGPDATINTAALSIIRCKSDVPELQRIFLSIVASWVESLDDAPTTSVLSNGFQRLAQLFEALGQPASSSLKGLWGELLLVAGSRDPALLTRAWHCFPTELYDFQSGQQYVEVKTTSVLPRRHDVSLAQLTAPEGSSVLLVSIVVDETDPRVSVWDLADAVKSRIGDSSLRLRVDEVIAATLGQDWMHARQLGFNVQRAIASVRVYPAERIPRVSPDFPSEVSDVRFRVELDGTEPLAYNELRDRGGLHAAVAVSEEFL
jgi:hypothetical protein